MISSDLIRFHLGRVVSFESKFGNRTVGLLLLGSFGLLSYSIVMSQGLIFTAQDFANGAGLVSQFPVSFWLGMILLLVVCVILGLGYSNYSVAVYWGTLVLVGFYLFGFNIAIQRIPFTGWTFIPYFTVDNVLQTGHLMLSTVSNPYYYYQLPGYVTFNTFILELTGLPVNSLLSLMPFLWIVAFPSILLCGCRNAGLTGKGSFVATLLVTSVWLYAFAGYEYPRLPATLLFLSILALILRMRFSRNELALTTILFAAVAITHSVTALAAFIGLFPFFVYHRKPMILIILTLVLVGWYAYIGYQYIVIAVSTLGEASLPLFTHLQNLASGSGQTGLLLERYLSIYDFAPFVATFIAVAGILTFRRPGHFEAKKFVSILLLTIGVAVTLPLYASGESIFRLFLLVTFPLAIAFVLLIQGNRLLYVTGVAIILSLVVVSPIVNYSTDTYHYFAPEAGLASFYAVHQTGQPFYYLYDESDMFYYNHNFSALNWARWMPGVEFTYAGMALTPVVITSYLSTTITGPPYSQWPSTPSAQGANKVYDNGYSQVFLNLKSENLSS